MGVSRSGYCLLPERTAQWNGPAHPGQTQLKHAGPATLSCLFDFLILNFRLTRQFGTKTGSFWFQNWSNFDSEIGPFVNQIEIKLEDDDAAINRKLRFKKSNRHDSARHAKNLLKQKVFGMLWPIKTCRAYLTFWFLIFDWFWALSLRFLGPNVGQLWIKTWANFGSKTRPVPAPQRWQPVVQIMAHPP